VGNRRHDLLAGESRAAGGAYIDHTSLVAVVGPDGRERLRYGLSQLGDPEAVARDLRHILDGG
jgi:cytochrome oxidase Cu insertion factor (SCO1/SenC/PrrC family)